MVFSDIIRYTNAYPFIPMEPNVRTNQQSTDEIFGPHPTKSFLL